MKQEIRSYLRFLLPLIAVPLRERDVQLARMEYQWRKNENWRKLIEEGYRKWRVKFQKITPA